MNRTLTGGSPRSRTARLLALVVLALTLLAPTTALAEKTLGVSSGTFRYELAAGDSAEGQVILTNDGDEPITVLVYAADQTVGMGGAIEFTVPSRGDITSLQQPSAWVRLGMPEQAKSFANVPYVELKPGDRVPIDFNVSVPNGVPPGDHNVMIFFEMAELPENAETTQMRVSGRIGSRITLRVEGELVERMDVRPFAVPAVVFDAAVPYTFTVNNSGNVDQRVTATGLLLDRNDATVSQKESIGAQTVFAGHALDASGTVTAGKYGFGPHTLRLEVVPVDEQGNPLAAGKNAIIENRSVWVLPIWLLVAVAVGLMLVIGVVATLVSRSRKRAKAASSAPAPALEDPSEDSTE